MKNSWWRRLCACAAAAALALTGAGSAAGAAGTSSRNHERRVPLTDQLTASAPGVTATGGITAHDGHFWQNGSPFVLRGVNVETHESFAAADATRVAGWGLNVIRLRIHWADIEPLPPVRDASGTWKHRYDAAAIAHIKSYVDSAWAKGIYTILDNHNCGGCGFFLFPGWTAQAAYNSKARMYPQTAAGLLAYQTDFWSDSLRQQFMAAVMNNVAIQFSGDPGVLGYEVLNEPQPGSLPLTGPTTRTMLNVQFPIAKAIRGGDPTRIVFFQTRNGYGPGLHTADLSAWQGLGNVAFDLHDGFGARWGNGLLMDPGSPQYLEGQPLINNNITAAGVPPYIGNTVVQVRIIRDRLQSVQRWGMPLIVGEFGESGADPGAMQNWGTILGALCYLGGTNASWAARDYRGPRGLLSPSGQVQPWTAMVAAQARQPC